MQKKNINKLDDYLNRIEAHEQAERKKKSMYLILLVGILAVGFSVFKFVDFGPQYRTFAMTDLNQDLVQTLFTEDEAPILVSHPDIGTDTIRNTEDYVAVLNLLDLIEQNRNIALTVSDDESDTAEEDQNKMSPYMVDIAGDRKAGQSLNFTIENYDSEVTYMIDYGNGYRRRVNKKSSYTYRNRGRFRIQLLATDKDNGSSVYTKRIEIAAAPAPTTQIASKESAPKKDEPMTDLIAENKPEETKEPIKEEEKTDEASNEETTESNSEVDMENLIASNESTNESKPEETSSLRTNNTVKDLPTTPSPASVEATKPTINTNKPLIGAQLMPEFPGGNKALARFFKKNYRYPKEAQEKGIEGVVYVRFVVNPDGSLTNIKVVKGVGSGCDKEAIRLTSRMPKWIPGEQDGVKVPVYKTIPVSFKLLK